MSKEELIELLGSHKEKQSKKVLRLEEKQRLQRRIAKIEADYETSMIPIYQEGGRGNQTTSKVENKILTKKEMIEEIERQIEKIDEEIVDLNYELNQVIIRLGSLSRLEKEIITAYYIDEMDYKTIGVEIYWQMINQTRSERTVARKIEEIMEKMLKL